MTIIQLEWEYHQPILFYMPQHGQSVKCIAPIMTIAIVTNIIRTEAMLVSLVNIPLRMPAALRVALHLNAPVR